MALIGIKQKPSRKEGDAETQVKGFECRVRGGQGLHSATEGNDSCREVKASGAVWTQRFRNSGIC